MVKLLSVVHAPPPHKYTAFFEKDDGKVKKIHFGASGYDDYLKTHDKEQRERYIARHRAREDFNRPMTAGALSRWILWGDSTSLETNIRAFKKRFGV
jgi:hypothetical protein